jgi:hypothetical protein
MTLTSRIRSVRWTQSFPRTRARPPRADPSLLRLRTPATDHDHQIARSSTPERSRSDGMRCRRRPGAMGAVAFRSAGRQAVDNTNR